MAKEAPKKGGAADPPAPANADPETRARSAAPVAPRYAVGIDLGTTHSVVAAVGLAGLALAAGEAAVAGAGAAAEAVVVEILDIPQAVGPGQVEGRPKLPSFLYQAHPSEYAEGDLVLPWDPRPGVNCGEWARELGRKTPIRLVASAKSWLCHGAVDRRAALLPADAPAEVARISPLAASTQYLAHLRAAWDHAHPEAPLAAQRVVLTVPASFDPAARELTVEAARAAGLPHAVLLEEPQAALYGWIRASGGRWREQVAVGEVILVVDVGGGTTDLSLVAVTAEDGRLALRRLAVGEHILLGGDNMDLALAYQVKAKLEAAGKALEAWQVQALTHACRDAKEALLAATAPETLPIVAPGRGGKLIGGALRTELTRVEVAATLVDGFFPVVPAAARPATPARAGLHVLGLPYAQDAAITRHLAAFLARHAGATAGVPGGVETRPCDFLAPTAILLNGGVFQGGGAGGAAAGGPQRLADRRRRPDGAAFARGGSRPGGGHGRRLLRLHPGRGRGADPGWHGGGLLRGGGGGGAGGAGPGAALACAVRGALRHGGGGGARPPGGGVWPGGGGAGAFSLLRLPRPPP